MQINDGSAQRSEVRSITVTFSDPVMFSGGTANAAAAFQLRRVSDGQYVNLASAVSTDAQGDTVVVLTFSGPVTDPESALNGGIPSLADGRYSLTITSSDVVNHQNQFLDGDANGVPGGDYISPVDMPGGGPGELQLYRIFGDTNGDGIVDQLDLGQFRSSFNSSADNPLYQADLDADNSGTIDQTDLGQFRSRMNSDILAVVPPLNFYVNPATGNDANDGRSPSTAWQTWDRLLKAVADGTITGGTWLTSDGTAADITTIPTDADKQAWYAAYQAGGRQLSGAHIFIDTSTAPLQVTGPLILPPGCEIESATNSLTNLEVNLPIAASEVWARPDAADFPDVWGTTSSTDYQFTGLYEQESGQWAQLLPIGVDRSVPTLADALPLLEANPGSFYVDPATNRLYTNSLLGNDPNTDGISRQYVPAWAATLNGRIIDVAGGEAYLIGGDGGFGFDPTTSAAIGTAGIGSGEWNSISMIDSCQWTRAGTHTFSAVGNDAVGLVVFRHDVAEEGPGGVFVGYWSHFVDYTAFTGVGSAMSIYDGDSTPNGWANVDAPGGSDADPSYLALIEHTDGSNLAFSERLLINCTFNGLASIGADTALAEAIDCVFNGSLSSDATTTIINGGTIGDRMPALGQNSPTMATLTAVTIEPGALSSYSPIFNDGLSGSITLQNCDIDLSGGNIYSTAWGRSGPVSLTLSNCSVELFDNTAYGLVYGWMATDSFTVTGSTFVGESIWPLFVDYNGTMAIESWQWARDQGYIDGTNLLNGSPWAA